MSKTKFNAHTMRESQAIRSKTSQNFLAAEFFSLHQYFVETTTTDIDMLLQV